MQEQVKDTVYINITQKDIDNIGNVSLKNRISRLELLKRRAKELEEQLSKVSKA